VHAVTQEVLNDAKCAIGNQRGSVQRVVECSSQVYEADRLESALEKDPNSSQADAGFYSDEIFEGELLDVDEVAFPLDGIVAPIEYLTLFHDNPCTSHRIESFEDTVTLDSISDMRSTDSIESETETIGICSVESLLPVEEELKKTTVYPAWDEMQEDETISFIQLFVQFDWTMSQIGLGVPEFGKSRTQVPVCEDMDRISKPRKNTLLVRPVNDQLGTKSYVLKPILELPENRDHVKMVNLPPPFDGKASFQQNTVEQLDHNMLDAIPSTKQRVLRKKSSLKKLNEQFKKVMQNAENSFKPWSQIKRVFGNK
jgi:hypothetical protein